MTELARRQGGGYQTIAKYSQEVTTVVAEVVERSDGSQKHLGSGMHWVWWLAGCGG